MLNSVNVLCGAGILSAPYAVKEGGWIGLSILFIFAVLAFYTGILLRHCLDSEPGIETFPDIGQAAFGIPGRIIVSACCVEFIILESDNLSSLFPNAHLEIGGMHLSSHLFYSRPMNNLGSGVEIVWKTDEGRRQMAYGAARGLIAPGKGRDKEWMDLYQRWAGELAGKEETRYTQGLGCRGGGGGYLGVAPRRGGKILLPTEELAGGVIATILVTICLFWIGLVDQVSFKSEGSSINRFGIPIAIGLYGYAYSGHAIFPNIYSSLKKPDDFSAVLFTSFVICTLLFTGVAVMGFFLFGKSTESQFTLNMPQELMASKVAVWTTVIICYH
ncbi:hypothetical protein KSP40_PGU009806 [Platanthera guangdongensis]|uniref:Amino acid transporter transmembrane domain-containing protein n=1 Tax=Platanthera guangdongensis TaxID=2320717 RepID=A0ABR2MVE1_9ASPA